MYLGQKDEKVHQFVLIKIKASIPDYNDGSFNLYQNELMNFFIFLTKVHPAFILDKSLKA